MNARHRKLRARAVIRASREARYAPPPPEDVSLEEVPEVIPPPSKPTTAKGGKRTSQGRKTNGH